MAIAVCDSLGDHATPGPTQKRVVAEWFAVCRWCDGFVSDMPVPYSPRA